MLWAVKGVNSDLHRYETKNAYAVFFVASKVVIMLLNAWVAAWLKEARWNCLVRSVPAQFTNFANPDSHNSIKS
jgi:hypothetical protein